MELEIPSNVYESRAAVVSVYYVAASSTMALSLYTVCVSSFATVYGHRLALLTLTLTVTLTLTLTPALPLT